MEINSVIITGTIREDENSHKSHNLDFRKITLESKRKSGTKDKVTIIYQEKDKMYNENERIKVTGSLRSRREGGRLVIYVYAESIEHYSGEEINELMLEGHVCSDPYYKEIPGRKLTQLLVCCENQRKTYASVVIWKKSQISIGQKLIICGRLQSRIYKAGQELRMINEISAYRAE